MRVLVPLFILLSLAAGCGGGSTSHSTPTPSSTATATRVPAATPAPTTQAVTPFTPVEDVLTPSPDTSGWLTYRDAEHRFELKYPPDAQIIENTYLATPGGGRDLGTKINLAIAQGTTLSEKYFFVEVTGLPAEACAPAGIAPTPQPAARVHLQLLHGNGADFWKAAGGPEVALGHSWFETFYTTSRGATCVTLDAVFSGSNPSFYSTPPPAPSAEDTSGTIFAAILSTFRWLDKP